LTTGILSAERGKETVFAGLEKARGTMEVRGGIVVQGEDTTDPADGTIDAVSSIQFQVATTAGGDPIPLDRMVIAYRSSTVVDNDMVYDATQVSGDDDNLLEPGELFTIELTAADNADLATLAVNERWTLEIQTPVGAVLDITRSMPAQIDAVMQLH
jgi:archaellin